MRLVSVGWSESTLGFDHAALDLCSGLVWQIIQVNFCCIQN
jgi:hypothetical protein